MDNKDSKILEAILFASGEPIDEDDLKEKEQKHEKTKIKRESFLDKLTKNLQDFLDNAE